MSTDLEQKFADALRRELGVAGPEVTRLAAPAPPTIHVSPTVSVALTTPVDPVEVFDVGRRNGAFAYGMRIKRDSAGQITDVQLTPETFYPLGAFE